MILKAIHTGVGFGSGTETNVVGFGSGTETNVVSVVLFYLLQYSALLQVDKWIASSYIIVYKEHVSQTQ